MPEGYVQMIGGRLAEVQASARDQAAPLVKDGPEPGATRRALFAAGDIDPRNLPTPDRKDGQR